MALQKCLRVVMEARKESVRKVALVEGGEVMAGAAADCVLAKIICDPT